MAADVSSLLIHHPSRDLKDKEMSTRVGDSFLRRLRLTPGYIYRKEASFEGIPEYLPTLVKVLMFILLPNPFPSTALETLSWLLRLIGKPFQAF